MSHQKGYLIDKDGLLYKQDRQNNLKLVISESLVHQLISQHHDSKYAAHAGVKKTQKWMHSRYYWANLHRDVERYILECDRCARFKPGRKKSAPMGQRQEARGREIFYQRAIRNLERRKPVYSDECGPLYEMARTTKRCHGCWHTPASWAKLGAG